MIEDDSIKVGLIAKPHGVNGEVVVRAEAGFSADDLCYEFLLIEIDGGLVPFYAEEIRPKSDDEVLAKFEFVDTQDEARRIANCNVYIRREWFDSNDEINNNVPTGFLVGYTATDRQNGNLGQITDIDMQVGANPLFVIEHNGNEILVPVADEFIVNIDDTKKIVTFDLPEGLIDL